MKTEIKATKTSSCDGISESSEIFIEETDETDVGPLSDSIHKSRSAYRNTPSNRNRADVSILIFAYNNLQQHTKYCIESILKYTKGIDYELVLLDNGSTDGTLEYFKSVPYRKKKIVRITENKGAVYGQHIATKYLTGRYVVMIAIDVYVTTNWLSNMIKCAESDERIGFVATVSDNISNFQAVNLTFDSLEEMQLKAERFNVSDPRKWEERLRLMPAIALYKRECLDIVGNLDYAFRHDFSDDDISFRVRRAGYKLICCGDVFVHHVGSSTAGSSEKKNEVLNRGREVFRQKYFGLDAWEDVNNFEPLMVSLVNPEEKGSNPHALGIDVMCGTPLLQLKSRLRLEGIFDTTLSAFGQEAKHWLDLKTICEGQVIVDRIEHLTEHFGRNAFDYILLGRPVNSYKDADKVLKDILSLLKTDGQLFLKLRNHFDARAFLNAMGRDVGNDNEVVSYIDANRLSGLLTEEGYAISDVRYNAHNMDDETRGAIRYALKNSNIAENVDAAFNGLLVYEYVIKISATRVNKNRSFGQDFQDSSAIGRADQAQAVVDKECAAGTARSNDEQSEQYPLSKAIETTSIAANLYKEAVKLQEAGNTELALRQFQIILDIEESDAEAHNDIGVLYFQEGNTEKAIYHLREAIKLDPENIDYMRNIATTYVESGKIDDAVRYYEDILKKCPEDVEVLLIVARLCSNAGLEKDAQFYFNRVLEIEPGNEFAMQSMTQ